MDEIKREHLEAAGFVVGDFEQFATEVLGMSVVEARETQFRADLGLAIRRLRRARDLTQAAFAKLVGVARPQVPRIEIGAPEISIDLMLKAYFSAGGRLQYEFDPPVVPVAAEKTDPDEAAKRTAKSSGPREVATVLKA